MTQKPPVHVERGESGWIVVRQGQERESSIHPTQSEAAKEGREVARREGTEFFLHAQDGRVRERRDYGDEEPRPEEKGVVGKAAETAGAVTGGTTAAASHTLDAVVGSEKAPEDQDAVAADPGPYEVRASAENAPIEEVGGLTNSERDDHTGTPEERYLGYEVYGNGAERIGKLDDLFVDENDDPEYIGVRMSSQDARSTLIPATVVTIDDRLRRIMVSRPKSVVENGPSLGYDEEFTPTLEERVRDYYGLSASQVAGADRSASYYRSEAHEATERTGTTIPGKDTPSLGAVRIDDVERGARRRPKPNVLEVEEELRVRRSEEELQVGTREYEAGAVRVRKRVRTERERIQVPKKRVEVTVERVPVEEGIATLTGGETATPEITEDEIVVPVIEEEVVVEKRPVIREEIRIRKEVVEETEVVEEDIRREEIEIDDETELADHTGGAGPEKRS